jgi:hypothetical protein
MADMSLTFPNASRSYDDAGHRIRFSGYDGMFEIKFFIDIDALKAIDGKVASETECLSTFDAGRKRIQTAAAKAYDRSKGKSMCMLTRADFG